MDKTSLGDRMKAYEKAYTSAKAMPLLPVIARLDGKAFHSWCKNLDKPFDMDFVWIMQNTAKELMHLTNALLAYTQSDEITLIFYSTDPESQIFFDGKLFKMTSVLASMCTAAFNLAVHRRINDRWKAGGTVAMDEKADKLFQKQPGTFDCRVFQVPTKEEAINCLIWREQDAVRNSILAVAQSKFSVKEMHKKSTDQLQEMLWQKHKINWGEDYPAELKRGTYYHRVKVTRPFTSEEIKKLPPKHQAHDYPDLEVTRSEIRRAEWPVFTKILNRVEVVFDGKQPLIGVRPE